VSIAFQEGSTVAVDLMPVLTRSLVLTGSTMRTRSAEEKSGIGARLVAQVWPLISAGKIKAVVHETLPLADAAGGFTRTKVLAC
jgi:NADPH:quinone reductase-like Zn-dependent oxidoreductase